MDYDKLREKQDQLKSVLKDVESEYAMKVAALQTDLTACVLAMGYGDHGHLLEQWYVHKDEGIFFYPIKLTNHRGFYEATGVAVDTMVFIDSMLPDGFAYEYSVYVSALTEEWKPTNMKQILKELGARLELILGAIERPDREYKITPLAQLLEVEEQFSSHSDQPERES